MSLVFCCSCSVDDLAFSFKACSFDDNKTSQIHHGLGLGLELTSSHGEIRVDEASNFWIHDGNGYPSLNLSYGKGSVTFQSRRSNFTINTTTKQQHKASTSGEWQRRAKLFSCPRGVADSGYLPARGREALRGCLASKTCRPARELQKVVN